MQKILKWIEGIVAVWGFLSIVAVILDAVGWLPVYDIHYTKKTAITPTVFMYPGEKIRLTAEFARSVESRQIESVVWRLKDSAGKEYRDLPRLRDVDLALLPDFSGTVNVDVKAKLFSEDQERHGSGSIHIVQTKPYQMVFRAGGKFALPAGWKDLSPKDAELYGGSAKWLRVSGLAKDPTELHLETEGRSFPIWDGKALLRYKSADDPSAPYRYETLTALDTTTPDLRRNQ